MKNKKAGTIEFYQGVYGKAFRESFKNKTYTIIHSIPGDRFKAERWLEEKEKADGPQIIGRPHPTYGIIREHNGDGTSTFHIILYPKEIWITPKRFF